MGSSRCPATRRPRPRTGRRRNETRAPWRDGPAVCSAKTMRPATGWNSHLTSGAELIDDRRSARDENRRPVRGGEPHRACGALRRTCVRTRCVQNTPENTWWDPTAQSNRGQPTVLDRCTHLDCSHTMITRDSHDGLGCTVLHRLTQTTSSTLGLQTRSRQRCGLPGRINVGALWALGGPSNRRHTS
jgi:hypothetical protein